MTPEPPEPPEPALPLAGAPEPPPAAVTVVIPVPDNTELEPAGLVTPLEVVDVAPAPTVTV